MRIAVDFDGTLHSGSYPFIGNPNLDLIQKLIEGRKNGDKVILWTCREDALLETAVEWCKTYGLEFDAVNDNLPGDHANPRKIFADVYIDDRALPRERFRMGSGRKVPKMKTAPMPAKFFS